MILLSIFLAMSIINSVWSVVLVPSLTSLKLFHWIESIEIKCRKKVGLQSTFLFRNAVKVFFFNSKSSTGYLFEKQNSKTQQEFFCHIEVFKLWISLTLNCHPSLLAISLGKFPLSALLPHVAFSFLSNIFQHLFFVLSFGPVFIDFLLAFSVKFLILILILSSCFLRGSQFSHKLISPQHRLVHLIRSYYSLIHKVVLDLFYLNLS